MTGEIHNNKNFARVASCRKQRIEQIVEQEGRKSQEYINTKTRLQ